MMLERTDAWLQVVRHMLAGITIILNDITIRRIAQAEREKVIGKLQHALEEVKKLSGMLPICATCKKVRDDKGYWSQIEAYVQEHSEAQFSHGMCPECMDKFYAEHGLKHV